MHDKNANVQERNSFINLIFQDLKTEFVDLKRNVCFWVDVPDCWTSFPNSNKNNSIRILNCVWKTKFAGSEFRKIFFKKLLIFIFIKKSCTVQKVNQYRCCLIFLHSSNINRKRYCNRNFYRIFSRICTS